MTLQITAQRTRHTQLVRKSTIAALLNALLLLADTPEKQTAIVFLATAFELDIKQ